MSKQYTTNVVHVTEFKFDVVKVKNMQFTALISVETLWREAALQHYGRTKNTQRTFQWLSPVTTKAL